MQPVVKPGCTTGSVNGCIVYTAGGQTGCTTRFDIRLNEQCCSFNTVVNGVLVVMVMVMVVVVVAAAAAVWCITVVNSYMHSYCEQWT